MSFQEKVICLPSATMTRDTETRLQLCSARCKIHTRPLWLSDDSKALENAPPPQAFDEDVDPLIRRVREFSDSPSGQQESAELWDKDINGVKVHVA